MLCHSVLSCHSPLLFLKRSLVARLNFPTGIPLGVYLTSGSAPTFPTRITLFMLFGMFAPIIKDFWSSTFSILSHSYAILASRHFQWEVGETHMGLARGKPCEPTPGLQSGSSPLAAAPSAQGRSPSRLSELARSEGRPAVGNDWRAKPWSRYQTI